MLFHTIEKIFVIVDSQKAKQKKRKCDLRVLKFAKSLQIFSIEKMIPLSLILLASIPPISIGGICSIVHSDQVLLKL